MQRQSHPPPRVRYFPQLAPHRTSRSSEGSIRSAPVHPLSLRISNDHPVAIEAAAEKFVRGAPKVEPETTIVELAKLLHDGVAVLVEIARPLLERQKIAEAIVEHFLHAQRSWRTTNEWLPP